MSPGAVPVGFGSIELGFDEGLAIGRLARDAGADFLMSQGPSDGDVMEYYRQLADIIPGRGVRPGQAEGAVDTGGHPAPSRADRQRGGHEDQRRPGEGGRGEEAAGRPGALRARRDGPSRLPDGRRRRYLRVCHDATPRAGRAAQAGCRRGSGTRRGHSSTAPCCLS